MINIRHNIFETNSSSTHSITMCSEDEYTNWKKGLLWYCPETSEFYNEVERLNFLKLSVLRQRCEYNYSVKPRTITYKTFTLPENMKLNEFLMPFLDDVSNNEAEEYAEDTSSFEIPLTFDQYTDMLEYEDFESEYITKSGEKVIAFGYYG